MTIDMHCHLMVKGFHNSSFIAPYWEPGQHSARSPEEAAGNTSQSSWGSFDPDGTGHIRRMDEAGIEKAVLLHIDMGILFGEAEMTIEQQNRYVSEVAGKYPGRFIWFCGVDPRRKEAAEVVEKCVNQWGARGIKFYPTTGFLPADKECYPLYERASAWKIPVYFHMGPESPPYKNEGNAHAAVLLRVLVDFPELTVIVAHFGFEFWRDLIALGKVRDNVMCDFCAWQRIARQNYGQFCHILRKFLDEFGKERVMFGTDAPLIEEAVSSKEWVEIIKSLPDKSPSPHRFTEEEVSAILDGNARRLLASIPEK
jgi:hypothetical protein